MFVCVHTHLPMHASRAQFLCCFFPDQCLSNYNGYRAVTRSVLHLMQTLGQCSGRHSMLKHNYVQTLQSDVAHCTGRYWTSLGEISLAVVDCWLYYAVPTHWILLSLVWNHTFAAVRALESYDTSTTSLKPVLNVINNLLGAKEVTGDSRWEDCEAWLLLWQWLQSIAETCIYNLNGKKNYK